MKTLIFLTALFLATFTQTISSQVLSQFLTEEDIQVEHFSSIMKRPITPLVQPIIDFEAIDKKNKAMGKYNQIAVKKTQNYDESYGEWFEQGGISLWVMRIKAPRAKNLNFWFQDLNLPESAKMFLYSLDTRFLQGPIRARNIYENEFASDLIEGKDVLITVEMDTEEMEDFSINITDVNQGIPTSSAFRGWQDALDCHYDVNCSEGSGWSLQRDAVAYVLFNGEYECSGTLMNNIHYDLEPFVLTALHCLDDDPLTSVSFRFKYEAGTPKCSGNSTGTRGTWITFSSGSLRASHADSDMMLLEMTGGIAGIKDMALAGWNRATTAASSGVGIHHPAGDAKKISVFSSSAVIFNDAEFPGPTFVDVWEVIWDKGLTEGGSSGGALFDQNKKIVGQLAGSPGVNCSTIDPTGLYGRMDISWGGNATNSGRLSNWLHDKSGTAPTTLNGIKVPYINPYATTHETTVCTSNKTFSLINSISGRTVTWSVSNTSLFGSSTSGSGTSATLRAASSSSKGNAVLTFTLTKSGSPVVTVTRDIIVGKPKFEFAKVNGSTSSGYSVVYPPANLTVDASGTNSFSWTRTSGSGNIYPSGSACLVYHNNVATVEASASNACGTTLLHSFILDDPSLMPLTDNDIYFRNPTDGTTEIDLTEIDAKINSISIFTSDYKLIKKLQNINQDYITIDLTENVAGLYFLTLETEDQIITKKLIKK